MLNRIRKLLNICLHVGFCHYEYEKSADLYIEFRDIFRKPSIWKAKRNMSIKFSIFRIDTET